MNRMKVHIFRAMSEQNLQGKKTPQSATVRRNVSKNRLTLFIQKTGLVLVDRLRNLYQSDGLENNTVQTHSHTHMHRRPMHRLINNIIHCVRSVFGVRR